MIEKASALSYYNSSEGVQGFCGHLQNSSPYYVLVMATC